MTPVRAPQSELFANRELIKLSRSGNVLSGPVLSDTRVNAFINSLVQRSKAFDSSYGVSFQKSRVADIARDLV